MRSSCWLLYFACAAAVAQTPVWTPVLKTGFGPFHEISLARDGTGLLHAVWRQQNADETFSYWTASHGEPVETAIRGWKTLSDPALYTAPDGTLTLLFGGSRGAGGQDHPFNRGSLLRAARPPEFVPEEKELSRSHAAGQGPIGLALARDGTLWTGWPSYADYVVQNGLDRPPFLNLASASCCTYLGQLAADAETGEVWAAWYSNAGAAMGLLVRRAAPQPGPLLVAPDSRGEFYGQQGIREPDQQLAFCGRGHGAGVFLAWCHGYPSCTEVRLWQPAQSAPPVVLARGVGLKSVATAPGPDGRLWVAWVERGLAVTAVRSNRSVTKFSRPYAVAAPAGYLSRIAVEGSPGPLDVFVNTGAGILRTLITPALEVQAALKGTSLTVKVSDLDDPVEGAHVQAGTLAADTGAGGVAVLELPAGARPAQVTVTHPGYLKASATVLPQR